MLNIKDFQYVTTNCNPDWHNNTGCQYPLICPKGTKVKFLRQYTNYYGTWFEVEYESKRRYIMPNLCDGNVIVDVKKIRLKIICQCKLEKIIYLLIDMVKNIKF